MIHAAEWQAIRLTVMVAGVAVLSTLPLAVFLGWIVAKKNFPGKDVLEVLINLPLVLPPVVTGYMLMIIFGRHGWLGKLTESLLGARFMFDWKGAALASAVVGFPLLVRPIRLAFEQIDDHLLQAARTLGATGWDAFFSIALPLARSGIYAGCVLAFARSMGEFGATIMIAGNIPGETQTVSLMIYSLLDSPNGIHESGRLVIASLLLATLALFVGEKLDRDQRQRTRGGR